jgi:hypothetical protein
MLDQPTRKVDHLKKSTLKKVRWAAEEWKGNKKEGPGRRSVAQ